MTSLRIPDLGSKGNEFFCIKKAHSNHGKAIALSSESLYNSHAFGTAFIVVEKAGNRIYSNEFCQLKEDGEAAF